MLAQVLADFFGKTPLTEEQLDEAMQEMDEDGSGEVRSLPSPYISILDAPFVSTAVWGIQSAS